MNVIVTTYNPLWTAMFRAEALDLSEVFGENLLDIHHIGSTSVPGLKAKPIIDIMPIVKDIQVIDTLGEKMQELGYEAMGEYGIPQRRYFRKGGENRTHHVHVFEVGSEHIERHLAFRDYLRAHLDEATRYGDLKEALAKRYPEDIEAYMDGKNDYIKRVESQALLWTRSQSNVG